MEQETLAGSPDTLGAVLQRAVAKPCEDVKSCPEAWSRKACLQTAGAGGGRKQRSWEPLLTPDPRQEGWLRPLVVSRMGLARRERRWGTRLWPR